MLPLVVVGPIISALSKALSHCQWHRLQLQMNLLQSSIHSFPPPSVSINSTISIFERPSHEAIKQMRLLIEKRTLSVFPKSQLSVQKIHLSVSIHRSVLLHSSISPFQYASFHIWSPWDFKVTSIRTYLTQSVHRRPRIWSALQSHKPVKLALDF